MSVCVSARQYSYVRLCVSTSVQLCPPVCQHISTVMSVCVSAHQYSYVPMPGTSRFIRIISTEAHYQRDKNTDSKRLHDPTLLSPWLWPCTVIVFTTLATDLWSITVVPKVWSAYQKGSASNSHGILGYVSLITMVKFTVLN